MKKIIMTLCGVAMMSVVALAQQTDTTNIRSNSEPQPTAPAPTQDATNGQLNQGVQQDSTDRSEMRDQKRKKRDKSGQNDANASEPTDKRRQPTSEKPR